MADKYSLFIYPHAAKDLESIFDYIYNELHNPTAAYKQIDDFEKALETLCLMPLSCPLVNNEYTKERDLRKLIVNNYIVFYRAKAETERIEVLRVLYGMMNFKNIL